MMPTRTPGVVKQSKSHCKCILSLSCPWHFLSDGTLVVKNRGRDKLMKKDRDLLYPWQNFLTYYRTRLTVVAYYKLATLQFVAYYKHFLLITGSRL